MWTLRIRLFPSEQLLNQDGDHQQYGKHRPNPHLSAHPSVCIIYHKAPFVARSGLMPKSRFVWIGTVMWIARGFWSFLASFASRDGLLAAAISFCALTGKGPPMAISAANAARAARPAHLLRNGFLFFSIEGAMFGSPQLFLPHIQLEFSSILIIFGCNVVCIWNNSRRKILQVRKRLNA